MNLFQSRLLQAQARNLLKGLDFFGGWLPPLALRLLLAYEFWTSGVEKFRGSNWFAEIQGQFPFPFNHVPVEISWHLATWFERIGPVALVHPGRPFRRPCRTGLQRLRAGMEAPPHLPGDVPAPHLHRPRQAEPGPLDQAPDRQQRTQALVVSILVGDIGGTHCRLAMATVVDHNGVILADSYHYKNADFAGLNAILADFLQHKPAPASACLAVAGPTDGNQVHFTNLDWHIDSGQLAQALGLSQVRLVNDFAAVGWGLNALSPEYLSVLQAGQPQSQGVKAAVGAGTGLGVSIGVPRDGQHHPLPTEGGHIGFAPLDAEQDRLLAFMRDLYGRVSVERLLSGPGIVDLYRFCAQEARLDPAALLAAPVPAQAISDAGLARNDPAAVHSMKLFAGIYGQVAGDVALLTQATAGIYLAGGIPPKILPLLNGPEFLAGFHAKGRFSDWMRTLPVAVILDKDIGLKGAALAGSRSANK